MVALTVGAMDEKESAWTRPLFADLTMESTREEVLAAVAELDEREARRVDDPAAYVGCGRLGGRPTALERNVMLQRQKVAGEEDQSVPGWDQGA